MKTENIIVKKRKRILECCVLLELGNKPLYVSDIIENIKKSNSLPEEGAHHPMLALLNRKSYLSYRPDNSAHQDTSNKVHLMWLWSGFLNVAH
jgi:PadR family transcriptional regulator PadR